MSEIIGYYSTKFGELWERSLYDLAAEAIFGVLKETKLESRKIDAIFYANMMGGVLENNLHATGKIAEIMGVNIPIFRVEAACASGGSAFHLATQYIAGNNKTVLVVGAEKQNDASPDQVTSALASAASGEEQEAGLTFPGLYGMMARYYLEKYKYTEESMAHIAVKNHYHGSLNDKAQFRRKITMDQVLKSPYVADPIKVLDSSPISDGAAALILSNDKSLCKNYRNRPHVLACEVATDTISLAGRARLDELKATVIASKKAYKEAGITAADIDVAEVHDCFTIAEILAMEDLGFWKKGRGGAESAQYVTQLGNGGRIIVNPSGGLKAAGHPVGATGIKQLGELYMQLSGQATSRQVKGAKYGLAHNVGGSGGTAVVTILGV